MTETTARFVLPLLQPGQAQKELYHNEALALLDGALHPVAQTIGDDVPPGSPSPGEAWIVGAAPSGDWSGRAEAIALWTGGGWRFIDPAAGMRVWIVTEAVYARWDGAVWILGEVIGESLNLGGQQVVGAREAAIADVAGGTNIDSEARTAIAAILGVLRNHGLVET